jgi:hypothetical protein
MEEGNSIDMAEIPLIAADGANTEDGAAGDAKVVLKRGIAVMLNKALKLRTTKGRSAPSLRRRILQVTRSVS